MNRVAEHGIMRKNGFGNHALRCGRGTGVARVEILVEHQLPRLLQAQHFLIVQRAHRSDGLEVLVERGNTHVHQPGQVFDLHGLRDVVSQPGNGLRNSVHAGFCNTHLRDANANGGAQ